MIYLTRLDQAPRLSPFCIFEMLAKQRKLNPRILINSCEEVNVKNIDRNWIPKKTSWLPYPRGKDFNGLRYSIQDRSSFCIVGADIARLSSFLMEYNLSGGIYQALLLVGEKSRPVVQCIVTGHL